MTLKELYDMRNYFISSNAPIPEVVQADILKKEEEAMSSILDSFKNAVPLTTEIERDFVVSAHYLEGKLKSVDISLDRSITEECSKRDLTETAPAVMDYGTAKDSMDETVASEPIVETAVCNDHKNPPTLFDDEDEKDRARKKSIPFEVRFSDDNRAFYFKKATQTFIEVLKYIGLERVSRSGVTNGSFPLVSKDKIEHENGASVQTLVDGWYVHTGSDNKRKKKLIYEVAKAVGLRVSVTDIITIGEPDGHISYHGYASKKKPKTSSWKKPKYSLNGSEPTHKNRTVLNTIRMFLKEFPDTSFDELIEWFPARLLGSYAHRGFFIPYSQVPDRNDPAVLDKKHRWFDKPEDVLTSGDGVQFVVSNQWGESFDIFVEYIRETWGWNIEEAK